MKPRTAVPWLLGALVIACGPEPELHGVTDDEIRASGVTQGIAGRAAWLVGGDCMPGVSCVPGNEPRVSYPFAGLWVLADGHQPRDLPCVGESLVPPSGVLAAADLTRGTFAVSLEPGRYQLLAVFRDGCSQCYSDGEGRDDAGVWQCRVFEVLPRQVTRADHLQNHCPQ